jgi:AcrR family transcriptional regulator
MKVNGDPQPSRRTQAERTAATRARLLDAGRRLFASEGYAAVSTQGIVDAAGVTRGALYHQFGDKSGLFAAVYERLEQDVVASITNGIVAAAPADHVSAMRVGARLFLEECSVPDVQRIVLVDAPAVLGWQRWREADERRTLGSIKAVLRRVAAEGRIPVARVDFYAHVLLAGMNEIAMLVARAEDPVTAAVEAEGATGELLDRLLGQN